MIACRRWPPTWSAASRRDRDRQHASGALRAKVATSTIPIVFGSGGDPVGTASSPASPGQAATSPASHLSAELAASGSSCCTTGSGGASDWCSSIRPIRMSRPVRQDPDRRRGVDVELTPSRPRAPNEIRDRLCRPSYAAPADAL